MSELKLQMGRYKLIEIAKVDVRGRSRKDLGDVAALAESIRSVGILQPIVVTHENKLVAGRRRIEALKRLKVKSVPAVVARSVDSLLTLIRAERDENTCRKGFTPEEAVRMGQRIEKEVSKLAKTECKKGGSKGGKAATRKPGPPSKGGETFPTLARDESKRTREQVASTVGMSGRQYEKAKAVVQSGNKAAIEQMNKSGKVDPAYRAVKRTEKKQRMQEKAAKVAAVEKAKWEIDLG